MKVAFDGRGAAGQQGVGRYVRCLVEALRETVPAGAELVEAHRPRRADIFHSPWITGALVHSPCPMVVTIHDLSALKRRSEELRTGIRHRLRHLAVQRAARVIVPTEAVAEDAVARLRIARDRLAVIPQAAATKLRKRPAEAVAEARDRYALPDDYLLWVGGLEHHEPRKRVAALAEAPRNLPLVMVGPVSPWATRLPGVTLTGHVPDDDLASLYTGARALVLASEDEGFGLQTIEALTCGTPVVACDNPSLREVLGDRATFVACDDIAGLVAAAERAERPAPAPPSWTWQDTARATWDVYAEALAVARR